MKILYVTTISDTVNAFLIPHIRFLIGQGNEVGVACNIFQEVSPDLIKLGTKVHKIEFQRNPLKKDNFIAYKKIKRVILEEGYELIHVHTPVASFITRLACRNIKNIKMLYTAHGFHFFNGAPKKNWIIYHTLEKIAAKWTDGIITMNSEDFHHAKSLKLRSCDSIYKVHGVGLDLYKFQPQTSEKKMNIRKMYQYDHDEFILIYVAELSFRKHQDLLIKAISKVNKDIPTIKLLLVGDGDCLRDYQELVRSLGLENHIEFLGYRKDIHHLMMLSDVALSTSRQEGLPVNVMEAMATGLPLIVTNCRGNRDLVKSEKNGFVIGLDDADECAEAIMKLYSSKELRLEFANQNKILIQDYSLDHVIGEMKEIYSDNNKLLNEVIS